MNEAYPSKEITLIAAASENNVLGKENKLIWHISDDLKRFKQLTEGHSVIMGRKTFESMPSALPKRINIILTKNKNYIAKNALIAHSKEEALALTGNDNNPFIIGGGEIYSLFLPLANTIELTRIHHFFDGDSFFPEISTTEWVLIKVENQKVKDGQPYKYSYLTYERRK